jgi:hypothetical protein
MTINHLDTGGYFMHQGTLKYCTFCSQFAFMLNCGSQNKEECFPIRYLLTGFITEKDFDYFYVRIYSWNTFWVNRSLERVVYRVWKGGRIT